MNIYSIIPARGGSKGVPGKNIRELNGEPLLAYSIRASLLSKHISRTIISTDSEEIAEIAKKYNAEVPFIRPAEYSGDKSTDFEFFDHAISWFKQNEESVPDLFIHLRPTTPLRDPDMIDKAIEKVLQTNDFTALRSVHEMSESAYKCFEIDSDYLKTVGTGSFELDAANNARQMFPNTYSANGYVDIVKSDFIIRNKKIHGGQVLSFVTDPVIEVDTIFDFEQLEFQISRDKSLFDKLF
jgi:CMP-N,N'-diacetyllegionaminic acid synthase